MALEQRLRQIEKRLKPQPQSTKDSQVPLREIPKETLIGAFAVLKDVGGYQYMLGEEYRAVASEEEISALNELTPEELYDMVVDQPSAPVTD